MQQAIQQPPSRDRFRGKRAKQSLRRLQGQTIKYSIVSAPSMATPSGFVETPATIVSEPSPPESNSKDTDDLWNIVKANNMASGHRFAKPTAASKARQSKPHTVIRSSSTSSSARSPLSTDSTATTAQSSIHTELETKSNKPPRVTDRNFRSRVLDRYGIVIKETVDLSTAYEHFSTLNPEEQNYDGTILNWYQEKHPDCCIWLNLDRAEAATHAEQYRYMKSMRENEAKFSHRGKTYFFKEDELFPSEDMGRCSSTYFKLEWGPTPDEEHLRSPPLIKPSAADEENARLFPFNTKPDCTYWLTLRRLNSQYRNRISTITHVLPEANVAAPYLTIEFKKDNLSFDAAENQIAVCGTLVLFNRVRLRCRRLKACGRYSKTWQQNDFMDIKHYGIAFNGCSANIYLIRPILCFESLVADAGNQELSYPWRGCTVSRFAVYDAAQEEGQLEIRKYVNEIHNWALKCHSDNFQLDIKGVLLHSPGGRDKVSISPDELKSLGLSNDKPT